MEKTLKPRQELILKTIIEQFIKNPTPIGSKWFINNSLISASSATIRNEMSKLEKYGLLEKTHTSSGRIPSTKGYKYYEEHISSAKLSQSIKKELLKIFDDRNLALEDIFDNASKVIQEATHLITLVRDIKEDVMLSKIDLVELTRNQLMIIIVSSNGSVNHKTITRPYDVSVKDLKICIRIINDRLIGTNMNDISNKFKLIKPLIKKEIHSYERVMQMFVSSIFESQNLNDNNLSNALTVRNQNAENIKVLLNILKETTIWDQIDKMNVHNERIQIVHTTDLKNVDDEKYTIAATSLTIPGTTKRFSIIGPERMDYSEVKGILEFLKEEFEKRFKK